VVQWTTARVGKVGGRYLGLDLATEIEYGITDRLQGALYILNDYHYLRNASGSSEVFDDVNRFSFNGVSAELKYQLLNPYKDAFGFAVYFEPGFKRISGVSGEREDEFELETKLILQKNFLDHRLITALNYTIEPEFEREPGESWETGLRMEGALGASYKMAGNWWIGAEARLDTEFEDADLNESEFVRLGIGPTIHYSGDKFFATLAVMPQVWGWPDRTGTGGMHLDEGERLEVRFKIGAEF
jgi:hypothetical protein